MKQFWKILRFELDGYLKNKVFVGITVFLVAAIAVCMFIPNIAALAGSDDAADNDADLPVMLVYAEDSELSSLVKQYFDAAFTGYRVQLAEGALEDLKSAITDGRAECAFAMDSASSYTYYVNNLSMYDSNTEIADAVLQEVYRVTAMVKCREHSFFTRSEMVSSCISSRYTSCAAIELSYIESSTLFSKSAASFSRLPSLE